MSSYLSTSRTHTAQNYTGSRELPWQLIIRNYLYCSIASRSYVVLALMCKLEPKLLHQMQLPKVKYRRKGKYCEREEKLQFARILTNLTEFKIFDCMLWVKRASLSTSEFARRQLFTISSVKRERVRAIPDISTFCGKNLLTSIPKNVALTKNCCNFHLLLHCQWHCLRTFAGNVTTL